MGKTIALYCEETPGLKLGPGITSTVRTTATGPADTAPLQGGGDVIVFNGGFATFDEDEFPLWEQWVTAPGSPTIRVLEDNEGLSTDGETFPCPQDCGKGPFKSQFALNSHLRAHARAAAQS